MLLLRNILLLPGGLEPRRSCRASSSRARGDGRSSSRRNRPDRDLLTTGVLSLDREERLQHRGQYGRIGAVARVGGDDEALLIPNVANDDLERQNYI